MTSPAAIRAGFARREITPVPGVPNLYGITCRVEQIWDPLYVTALYLTDGTQSVVLVGADVLEFLRRPYDEITQAIRSSLGDLDLLVVNASHTHSGPYVSSDLERLTGPHGIHTLDLEYFELIRERTVAAAVEAARVAEPARLAIGCGIVSRVASNRRVKDAEGRTIHRYGRPPAEMRALSEGLIDPEVMVLRIDGEHGEPLGAIVNYACHPTAAGGGLHPWVSADFVGAGLRIAEEYLGAPCLFLQGAAGNIGTGKWIEGTPRTDVAAMGRRLADGIVRALESLAPLTEHVAVAHRTVVVELDPFPPLDQLQSRFRGAIDAFLATGLGENHDPEAVPSRPIPELDESGLALGSEIAALGQSIIIARDVDQFRQVDLHALRLGEAAIAFLPAESFVEFGLEIKQQSPFARRTIVSAYNDCSLEYIPTASAFPEGEFEVDGGWRYIVPGAGEVIAGAALEALQEL